MAKLENETATPGTREVIVSPLSKNAIKRQLKRQRWEDSKADRKAYKTVKLKE
jgi:hypothetical protein